MMMTVRVFSRQKGFKIEVQNVLHYCYSYVVVQVTQTQFVNCSIIFPCWWHFGNWRIMFVLTSHPTRFQVSLSYRRTWRLYFDNRYLPSIQKFYRNIYARNLSAFFPTLFSAQSFVSFFLARHHPLFLPGVMLVYRPQNSSGRGVIDPTKYIRAAGRAAETVDKRFVINWTSCWRFSCGPEAIRGESKHLSQITEPYRPTHAFMEHTSSEEL
jgi:hypothetical protein